MWPFKKPVGVREYCGPGGEFTSPFSCLRAEEKGPRTHGPGSHMEMGASGVAERQSTGLGISDMGSGPG